jgi:hypothetical protein
MKLRIAITCLSACLLPAPALRAQDSPRVACYDLTVRIDVPERRVTVGGSFDVNFLVHGNPFHRATKQGGP